MSEGLFSPLLTLPLISRVRRNHALEHATMQVLAETRRTASLVGRSSFWGFAIYGDVSTADLLGAASEALERLKAGERTLAVHPNCGSNYVVGGTAAGLGAFLMLGGLSTNHETSSKERLARLPLACAVATLAFILSKPLGVAFQTHVTTDSEVGDLSILGATRRAQGSATVHFVRTAG